MARTELTLTDADHDKGILGRLRSKADNPDERIRLEQLAMAIDRHAPDETIFTSDTGMSTVRCPLVALCGDGRADDAAGRSAHSRHLRAPVRFVVFDNGRLGMVRLEQEQGGLPEFATRMDNPDLAAVALALGLTARWVTEPDEVDDAVRWAMAQPGPVLLDVVTNPQEVSAAAPLAGAGLGLRDRQDQGGDLTPAGTSRGALLRRARLARGAQRRSCGAGSVGH